VEKEAAGLVVRRSAVVARWSHRVGERTDAMVVLCYEEEVFCDARFEVENERGEKDRPSKRDLPRNPLADSL